MRKVILIGLLAIVAVFLSSCKTKYMVQTITNDSLIYVTKWKDKFVKETDTVNVTVTEKGDTIYKEVVRWRIKEVINSDTIYVNNETEKEVPVEVVKPYIPKWCWYVMGGLLLYVLWSLFGKIIKIYLKGLIGKI